MRFKIEPGLLIVLSELFVNLAAGWFGAVFIVPNFSGLKLPFNLFVLTMDILLGIFSLVVAFKLRKLSKGEK